MNEILDRISKLTAIDMQNKTLDELFASLAEEYGELARELKIEEKVFGNAYKKADEGCKAESVDLFICAVCMYFATVPRVTSEPLTFDLWSREPHNQTPEEKKQKVFRILYNMAIYLGFCKEPPAAILIGQHAIDIFFNRGGEKQEFISLCKAKLDKWEKSQKHDKI